MYVTVYVCMYVLVFFQLLLSAILNLYFTFVFFFSWRSFHKFGFWKIWHLVATVVSIINKKKILYSKYNSFFVFFFFLCWLKVIEKAKLSYIIPTRMCVYLHYFKGWICCHFLQFFLKFPENTTIEISI